MEYETGRIILGFLNGNDIASIGSLHPLLMVDCWEHAFVHDFGTNGRREYITKYTTEIDWRMVWRDEGGKDKEGYGEGTVLITIPIYCFDNSRFICFLFAFCLFLFVRWKSGSMEV